MQSPSQLGLTSTLAESSEMKYARRFWAPTVILAAVVFRPLRAEEQSFVELRHRQDRSNFEAGLKWIADHPDSPERSDAAEWCLEQAFENGWYADVLPLAGDLAADESLSSQQQRLARHLRCLGLAADDQVDRALEAFAAELKRIRLRSPNETLQLAFALSAQLQIVGDVEAAREVLKSTGSAFFLNEEVRTICDRRVAKLLLLGAPAEDVSWTDVAGNAGRLSDLKGQVVLLDFWATNCAPCVADLPRLKSVFQRFHTRGLRIVGLSLDRSDTDVEQFQKARRIPWPLALVTSSTEKPREKYRVVTIPSTFLIDREGKIVLVDGTAKDVALMLERMGE